MILVLTVLTVVFSILFLIDGLTRRSKRAILFSVASLIAGVYVLASMAIAIGLI